jgi:hypothetical protein
MVSSGTPLIRDAKGAAVSPLGMALDRVAETAP